MNKVVAAWSMLGLALTAVWVAPAAGQGNPSAFNAPNFWKGSTYEGDVLRGAGALAYGQGAMYFGAGYAFSGLGIGLEASARAESERQRAIGLALANQREFFELYQERREFRRQELQASLARQDVSRRLKTLDRLRDTPDLLAVDSGEALNFLLDELGEHTQATRSGLEELDAAALEGVRLRTTTGWSAHEGLSWITLDGDVLWPTMLMSDAWEHERSAITGELQAIMLWIRRGEAVSATRIRRLRERLFAMSTAARQETANYGAQAWHELLTFQRAVDRQLEGLLGGDGDLIRQGALEGPPRDAQELVDLLVEGRMRFAPVEPNGASTYRAMHGELAREHRANEFRRVRLAGRD